MTSTEDTNGTRAERILLALTGLLVGLACCMQYYAAAGGDQAWLLLATRMWLTGSKPYVDIFEVNPPLILWLYAVPVFVAQHLPILSAAHILVIIAFFSIALCIRLCDRLVALHPQATPRRRLYFALLLAGVFILFVNPLYFFDREHIFTVLIFPYLLRFAPFCARAKLPIRRSALIGVMAAVGFCLKPHCVILFAGVQLVVLLRERRWFILWSLENLLIYALALLYLLAIGLLTPEYYTIVLPMAFATYGGYSQKDTWIVYVPILGLILGVTFVDFRLRYRTLYRPELCYFLALVPFFFAYALLNNGWGYTYVPINTLLFLLTGIMLAHQLTLYREQGVKRALQGVRACTLVLSTKILISVLAYILAIYVTIDGKNHESKRNVALASLARESRALTFGALSADFGIWPPLMEATGLKLVTRFHHLWMLPRFITQDDTFARSHAWVLAYVAGAFAQDLRDHHPDIVFVDVSPSFFRTHRQVDILAYLSAYPDFRKEWSHYRRSGGMNDCRPPAPRYTPLDCSYDIYQRIP